MHSNSFRSKDRGALSGTLIGMESRSPSHIGRVLAMLIVVLLLLFGIVFALQSTTLLNQVCANANVQSYLPTTLFSKVCATHEEVGFPSVVPGKTPIITDEATRGIQCPTTAAPGTPITISWSCGTSFLKAVAGFSISNRTQVTALVVPTASSSVYGIQCADGYQDLCSVNTVDPHVSIWSDPAHVRLGARANIFWDSQDTVACHVTGPSFDETGIRGGAATVPVTTPTTFTIICLTTASTTISSSVLVDFAQ